MRLWPRDTPEIPEGLRRAYLLVLAPVAAIAPLPLFWTEGALPLALAAYELALWLLWWRAHADHPVRLSDTVLNALGISYFVWLGVEVAVFHHGLLRSVSHLLLFTTIAKLASLKRPGEARTALLVIFLITLASASSATHVASLLYFAAMAFIGFRALGRLAVLADFDDAPPDRILRAVPTRGVAATVIVAAALVTAPLFYALPRVRSPYVTARIRVDDALSTALAADRVDLEGFGAAKRSDRVVLRMNVAPDRLRPRVLRLREAVFTDYRAGVWTRNPYRTGLASHHGPRRDSALPDARPSQVIAGRVSIDLNPFVNGFLFLPYESVGVELDRGYPVSLTDGIVRLPTNRRSVRYTAGVRRSDPRGIGATAIAADAVPPEIRDYAAKIAGDATDPVEVARRIRVHFVKDFVYTLDAPRGTGDPIVHFLLRSHAGHCEFFASAAALMLTARGIPARLVTGSYGGESGLFSPAIVVRGTNLHAWVEAELDGSGFSVFDPTPPGGVPPAVSGGSFWRGIASLGREAEFFYDRRILGFDAFDQAQFLDLARQSVGTAAERVSGWKPFARTPAPASLIAAASLLVALSLLALLRSARMRRARVAAPTRAYIRLRGIAARRLGGLAASTPPAEVARLLGDAVPDAREDAAALVLIYCESAFGGREPAPGIESELGARLKRLRKLA
ncbi:MAG: transglutaminaseTgpA domain-containing protein [Acidobacteriota bacterium]